MARAPKPRVASTKTSPAAVSEGAPEITTTETGDEASTVEIAAVEAASEPHTVVHTYGYYDDDDGLLRHWPAGRVLTDPEEIEHLRSRGVILEAVTE